MHIAIHIDIDLDVYMHTHTHTFAAFFINPESRFTVTTAVIILFSRSTSYIVQKTCGIITKHYLYIYIYTYTCIKYSYYLLSQYSDLCL